MRERSGVAGTLWLGRLPLQIGIAIGIGIEVILAAPVGHRLVANLVAPAASMKRR